MPVPAPAQLPLPPLQTYVALSFLFLAWSILQAREGVSLLESIHAGEPGPVEGVLTGMEPGGEGGAAPADAEQHAPADGGESGERMSPVGGEIIQNMALEFGINEGDSEVVKMMKLMLQDSLSVVVVMNMAICGLILLGKAIQHLVFGDLRVIERQHLRDKLWNFSFYKLIVVFGVLNVQTLEELVLWVGWFAVLAFLHGFAQLSKDRFEYLSFSPTTPNKTHSLVISLLVVILGITGALMAASFYLCYQFDWNLLFFMLAECILIAVRAIYVLARYAIHLYDLHHDGVWEKRGPLIYYTELVLELVTLSLDFVHHLHMLLWVNVFLSMASLLICMQLRHLYYEIQRRVQRHRNYRRVVASMEARFPKASPEELAANNDDCAICWEEMKGARKLPCGHLFHDSCLRSWLEHETSCPTCRQSLSIQTMPTHPITPRHTPGRAPGAPPHNLAGGEARPNPAANLRNHFFHFDGSRIFSWLPSFSVEVTHTHMMAPRTVQTSQLDNMARQVSQMFPNIPSRAIVEDLRITRSIELTVNNILDGRVTTIGLGGENTAEDTPGDPEPNTFQTFQTPREETPDEGGLLYRQTRQQGEAAVRGETARGQGTDTEVGSEMEGTEDNAANWNRPDNSSSEPSQDSSEPGPSSGFPSYSSRFSKSSSERESILRQRKEKLMQQARRKFQDKQQREFAEKNSSVLGTSSSSSSSLPSSSSSSSNQQPSLHPSVAASAPVFPSAPTPMYQIFQPRGQYSDDYERQRRRTAALEAALRRLGQQQPPQ